MSADHPSDAARLDAARRELGLSFYDLWIAYFGVGGRHDAADLRALLTGNEGLSSVDHDHLALAMNELYDDAGADHPLPYLRH